MIVVTSSFGVNRVDTGRADVSFIRYICNPWWLYLTCSLHLVIFETRARFHFHAFTCACISAFSGDYVEACARTVARTYFVRLRFAPNVSNLRLIRCLSITCPNSTHFTILLNIYVEDCTHV